MFTLDDVEYRLPLAKVMALIHAGQTLDGVRMIWESPLLNAEVAFIEAARVSYAAL